SFRKAWRLKKRKAAQRERQAQATELRKSLFPEDQVAIQKAVRSLREPLALFWDRRCLLKARPKSGHHPSTSGRQWDTPSLVLGQYNSLANREFRLLSHCPTPRTRKAGQRPSPLHASETLRSVPLRQYNSLTNKEFRSLSRCLTPRTRKARQLPR